MGNSRKGKWTESRMTAVVISKLMGCSLIKAKKILYRLRDLFPEVKTGNTLLNEDILGAAIQEVRNQQDLRKIRRFS